MGCGGSRSTAVVETWNYPTIPRNVDQAWNYPTVPRTVETRNYPTLPGTVETWNYPTIPGITETRNYPTIPRNVDGTWNYPTIPGAVETRNYPTLPGTVESRNYPTIPGTEVRIDGRNEIEGDNRIVSYGNLNQNALENNITVIDASSKDTRPVEKLHEETVSKHIHPEISSRGGALGQFSASPFDPSVDVGKYRNVPIPVFGRDAFKLSTGQPEIRIEDTFWAGKRALIPDYSKMRRLDKHAIEAPANIRSNLDKLIPYLVKGAKTDLEKLRVIFRWCAHNIKYNVDRYNTGDYGDNSVQAVLNTGIAVCEGYAVLMVEMCKRARVECKYVSGHCKGSGYEPEMTDFSEVSHAWNQVTLNGQKFFCDCTWAAGSCNLENGLHVFSRSWNEQEFLTNPQGFTGLHLTPDLDHQDCPCPYKSLEEWNNEPVFGLASKFAGLKCLTHKDGIIQVQSKEVLIKFKLDRALYRSFCILEKKDGSKVTNAVQHWWNKDEVSCRVTLPTAGKYIFMFLGKFTRQGTDNKNKDVDWFPVDVSDALQDLLVTYTIKATGNKLTKLPSVFENNLLGAPLDLSEAGLVPATENQGIIKAPNGVAHVVFQKVRQGPSWVNTKLVSFRNDQKELKTAIYCEQFGKWVVCHVRCPSSGKFALSLFVKGASDDEICVQYTIESEGNVKPIEIPDMLGMAGPQAKFQELGLKLRQPLSSTVVTQNGEGNIVVSWNTSKKLRFICELRDVSGTRSLEDYGYAISETETGNPASTTTLSLRLKEKGLFKLTLFGKHDWDNSTSVYPSLCHWLVVCNKASDKDPYPLRASAMGPRENFHPLGLKTTTDSRIICKNGEAVMVVSSQLESHTEFFFNLSRTNDDEKKGQVFADTITTNKERITTFHFRIKESGSYAFRLFALQNGAETGPDVGIWHIVNDVASKKRAFPGQRDYYGPKKKFRDSCLQVDEATSKKLTLTAGEGELRITHKPGTRCAMTAHLETGEGEYERTKVSTLIEREWSGKDQVLKTRLRMRIRDPGLYDLVVFTQKDGIAHQYDYAGVWLVECAAPSTKPLFPETHGTMGPDENFFKMGLSVVSPCCSTIKPSKDGVCTLIIQRDRPFETIFEDFKDECEITTVEASNGKHVVTCSVRLPRAGLFGLTMYASEPGVDLKNSVGDWLLDGTA